MKHIGGGLSFFYESVGRNFLRCLEERSITAARTAARCNLYFRRRKHVRRVSRASRCVFQAPYINPLFNTPLSARPAGKGKEGVVAGEDGGETRAAVVNRNYEAARLRICRAGSKRFRESVRAHAIAASDALDHRREYSARRL